MSKLYNLWNRLQKKDYRHSYLESKICDEISAQVYHMRSQRAMTQDDLAKATDMRQSYISKLERSVGNITLQTLLRLAKAFDVALIVRFVPYSILAKEVVSEKIDGRIVPFGDDSIGSRTFQAVMDSSENRIFVPPVSASAEVGKHAYFASAQGNQEKISVN